MTNEAQLAGALGHEVHTRLRAAPGNGRSRQEEFRLGQEEAKSKTEAITPEYVKGKADAFLTEMFNMR